MTNAQYAARPMTAQEQQVQGLMTASFELAKRLQSWGYYSQGLAALCAIVTVLNTSSTIKIVFGCLGLIAIIARYLLSLAISWPRGRGERCRRRLLTSFGLRDQSSEGSLKDVIAEFTDSNFGKTYERKDWFTTKGDPGPDALLEAMWENAFFVQRIYSKSGWFFVTITVLSMILLMTVTLVMPIWLAGKTWLTVLQAVSIFVAVTIAVDVLGQAIKFHRSAISLSKIETAAKELTGKNPAAIRVLDLFGDYNSIVEGTPLVPSFIWERYRNKIRKAWDDRRP